MVREDGENNWTTQPTYDALLIRYLPQLLGKEETQTEPEVKQEPLPTPTASTAELDQLSRKIQKETALILDKIFNQVLERELKNVYEIEAEMNGESAQIFTQNLEDNLEELSEIEDNMKRESAHIWVSIEAKVKRAQILDRISNKILEQKLKEVYEIEAKLQTEAWTVITQMDTIMLRTWLNKASKFQGEMENGAFAPEPIQLSTDALFSAPMLSMGRRRVQGVKMLRDISRGALKENRPRIDNIIKLYENNELGNIKTAENIVDRLTSKRKDKRYTDKTNQLYNKITMNAEGQKDLDIASGVRKAALETKNVMVTMILYREKEDDKAEKQREKQKLDTPVNIDFPKGTTVADAKEEKEELRKTGNQFASKLRYAKNLKQFYIGSFELKIDDTDKKWLKKRNRRQNVDKKGRGHRRRFQSSLQIYGQTQRGFCTPHGVYRRILLSGALPYEN